MTPHGATTVGRLPKRRVQILGCGIDALTMDAAVSWAAAVVGRRTFAHCTGVNAAKLVDALHDERLRDITGRADLVTADGQSVVWASRLLDDPLPERVAGIDLMLRLFAVAEERGWRVFLLGARPEVVEETARRVHSIHPRLVLAGYRDGYFSEAEDAIVAAEIAATRADVLFVGITSPRKEYFIDAWGPKMDVPLVMGVGGAFDVVAGLRRRAPDLVQRLGLEWLFRLVQEPRRLFRRYAITNARFMTHVLRDAVRRRVMTPLGRNAA